MDGLSKYMLRAGIQSRRELSRITGIPHATLDAIFKHPEVARGYQMAQIAAACSMSCEEIGSVIRRED